MANGTTSQDPMQSHYGSSPVSSHPNLYSYGQSKPSVISRVKFGLRHKLKVLKNFAHDLQNISTVIPSQGCMYSGASSPRAVRILSYLSGEDDQSQKMDGPQF